MKIWVPNGWWLFVVMLVIGSVSERAEPASPVPVPVSEIASVAGKWTGLVHGIRAVDDTLVEMTIRADGSYDAVTYKQIGMFRSQGRMELDDGLLKYSSARSRGTMSLVRRSDGTLALKLAGSLEPVGEVTAELTRAKR